jgi:hypothetical protein
VLTREQILGLAERPPAVESVDVPEWGGPVYVRAITCREKDAYEESRSKRGRDGKPVPNLANLRARFASLVICDGRGERLFSDDDAGQLGDLPVKGMERVIAAASRLNGMTEEDVEQAVGNSGTAPPEGSCTASP